MFNDLDFKKIFPLMTFESGEEETCRKYMETRGIYLYKQVYDALATWMPNVKEIKYKQFSNLIRYDKGIRDKLYIYLAAAEEYLRNIIFEELEIDTIKVDDNFKFPSFCFDMATGIGKTRLMGAAIYYLYKTKGYKHFFILAPGNTIYDKLRKESNPAHPKYIFKGLEAEMGRPKVYDGENYVRYPARFVQGEIEIEKTSEIQLFIFNIGKIFNSKTDTTFKFHKYQETLGSSFADVLPCKGNSKRMDYYIRVPKWI